MNSMVIFSLACALQIATIVRADDPPAPTATSLSVIQKGNRSEILLPGLNREAAVQLSVLLEQPEDHILSLDSEESKLESAVDDKGTDLTADLKKDWAPATECRISENCQKIGVPILLQTLPASGASTVHVKAQLVLICGTDEQEESIEVDPANAVKKELGENTVTVAVRSDDRANVEVKYENNGNWVKSVTFLDEEGQELKSNSYSTSTTHSSKKFTLGRTYYFEAGKTVKTVKLRYFAKSKPITRAVDLNVGLSL